MAGSVATGGDARQPEGGAMAMGGAIATGGQGSGGQGTGGSISGAGGNSSACPSGESHWNCARPGAPHRGELA
jgi:hypothetical protein